MHYKQNNKESKTYVQGLRLFGNTLPRGLKGILKKNGYNFAEIVSKWSILTGTDISNMSHPKSIKMSRGNENGTLILSVKRGDEIAVEYSKKEMINKINGYFGYKLISEIKLHSANTDVKKLKKITVSNKLTKNFEEQINKFKSVKIRNSLAQLIKVIKND